MKIKKKILFFALNLISYKSLVPYIIKSVEDGHDVTVRTNFFNNKLADIIFDLYKTNYPLKVNLINKNTINKLSKNYKLHLPEKNLKFSIIFSSKYLRFLNNTYLKKNTFDIVIGTLKDNLFYEYNPNLKYKKKFAIGIPPFPVNINFQDLKKFSFEKFGDGDFFFKYHKIDKIIKNQDFTLRKFSYIKKNNKTQNLNRVLLLHPGGYRGVVTDYGASKKISNLQNSKFIKSICETLETNGYECLIKIHPLHAKFHGEKDLNSIVRNLNLKKTKVLGPYEGYFDLLNNCKFVLSCGSTSIHEIMSMGYKNIFLINFFGTSRTSEYYFHKENILESLDDLDKICKEDNLQKYLQGKFQNLFNFYNNLEQNIDEDLNYFYL